MTPRPRLTPAVITLAFVPTFMALVFAYCFWPVPTEPVTRAEAKDDKVLRSILVHFQMMSDQLAAAEARATPDQNAMVFKVARMAYDQCIERVKQELDKPTEAQ